MGTLLAVCLAASEEAEHQRRSDAQAATVALREVELRAASLAAANEALRQRLEAATGSNESHGRQHMAVVREGGPAASGVREQPSVATLGQAAQAALPQQLQPHATRRRARTPSRPPPPRHRRRRTPAPLPPPQSAPDMTPSRGACPRRLPSAVAALAPLPLPLGQPGPAPSATLLYHSPLELFSACFQARRGRGKAPGTGRREATCCGALRPLCCGRRRLQRRRRAGEGARGAGVACERGAGGSPPTAAAAGGVHWRQGVGQVTRGAREVLMSGRRAAQAGSAPQASPPASRPGAAASVAEGRMRRVRGGACGLRRG